MNDDQTEATGSAPLAAALGRLEAFLRAHGAAVAQVMRPGIDAAAVEQQLREVGLAPTPEVLTWFAWHDGAGATGMPSQQVEIVPGGEFYELAYLCGEYRQTRQVAAELAAHPQVPFDDEDSWPVTFFPLLRLFGKGFLAVDLAGAGADLTPVHISWHDDEPGDRRRVAWPSVTAFVDDMTRRFEAGTYSIDSNGIVVGDTVDRPPR